VIASAKRYAAARRVLARCPEALARVAAPPAWTGARSPRSIAVSIMAQIVEHRRGRSRRLPGEGAAARAQDPVCGMTVA